MILLKQNEGMKMTVKSRIVFEGEEAELLIDVMNHSPAGGHNTYKQNAVDCPSVTSTLVGFFVQSLYPRIAVDCVSIE